MESLQLSTGSGVPLAPNRAMARRTEKPEGEAQQRPSTGRIVRERSIIDVYDEVLNRGIVIQRVDPDTEPSAPATVHDRPSRRRR